MQSDKLLLSDYPPDLGILGETSLSARPDTVSNVGIRDAQRIAWKQARGVLSRGVVAVLTLEDATNATEAAECTTNEEARQLYQKRMHRGHGRVVLARHRQYTVTRKSEQFRTFQSVRIKDIIQQCTLP